MPNIIGSFVFRNEGDGCLTSKYINRGMNTPLVECSKVQGRVAEDGFSGNYFSVWLDSSVDSNSSSLRITRNNESFDLRWTNVNSGDEYAGQGMLIDGLLVGSYWSYDLNHILPT